MTSKLTREENVQAVFDLKAGYTLGLADVEILKRVARMALAAMDSESGCLPLDYLQGHKDGLEWAARLAEANHPDTGDWLYDDPIELAKAIRKGPDMPPAQPVEDSEPDRNPVLAYADSYRDMAKQGVQSVPIWSVITDLERNIAPLYRHAQPVPVVPDDVLAAIQKVARIRLDLNDFDGDRRGIADCLYDAEEALIEVVNRRAAMLQAQSDDYGEPTDDERIMAIEGIHNCERCSDGGWVIGEMGITRCACGQADSSPVIPGAEQRIADAVELLQKAAPAMLADNSGSDGPLAGRMKSPVIPDAWIPVSERMPDDSSDVLCTAEFDGPGDWRRKVGYWHEGKWVVYGASWMPTHWMPLPAAPQEVKGE
ncbi:DUF551 domain-containing protein [Klebsiella grimontii]|uniref:DUF551 domain-containing protein n=1 Tax=Klebsiella grimontii TaxID=2058152 RepID=A0ABD7ALI3_9ENTR|nr:DUF551 domain-containing protein [Klebsiella grimontii]